jgi:hypothetical protein
MKIMTTLTVTVAAFAAVIQIHANIVQFDLYGNAGAGLLPGNSNPASSASTGSGGEIGGGIFLDDVTGLLSVNVGWGSGNGFTDLTGDATAAHIHGPTAAGAAGLSQNVAVLFPFNNLGGNALNLSGTAGSFIGTFSLTAGQILDIEAGKYYVNVHTTRYPGGEIRGQIEMVPEPGSMVMGTLAAGGLAWLIRRRSR